MHEARRNLLVGLFVLVGLSVLGVLIVLFGRGPTQFLGSPGYPLNIHFERIAGIRPGNDVTIGGIRIGRVSDVGFFDPQQLEAGANVKVMIEQDFRLPNGSRAVTNEPVLGQGRPPIEIVPGPPGMSPLEPGAVIPGELRGAVDAIVPEDIRAMFYKTTAQVGETADKLTPVLEDLHKILTWREPADVDRPGGPSGNLASAMVRLDGAVKHFNEVLGDPAARSTT